MYFLSPYWLFAASAILIPIAIHLWNKRQGKTVKVGSIRWLEASASKQWRSIRLTDVWMLLLRCLVLVLLAFALAGPFIEMQTGKEQGEKVVLVSPELLYSEAITSLEPTIDSLLLRSYTLRAFTPEFNVIPQEQWQQLKTNPVDSIVANGNYWELLSALAQKYTQPQDSILLFTSDLQRHFIGSPSPLQENIKWISVALDKKTSWLQAAYLTATDSVLLITGESTRNGTRYRQHTITNKPGNQQVDSNQQVRLVQQPDSLWAYWGAADQQPVLVKQRPLQVSIMAATKQQSETKYLRAALEAISSYTGIPVTIGSDLESPVDWLFWLSDAAVPDSVLNRVKQGSKLWLQPGNDPKAISANLVFPVSNIKLHQLAPSETKSGDVIWFATDGQPVLTAEMYGKGQIYIFRSGFSPEWSSLGQSPYLPDLLLPFLFSVEAREKYDARALPEAVLTPVSKELKPADTPKRQLSYLTPWFILAAFILFLAERIIANKRVRV